MGKLGLLHKQKLEKPNASVVQPTQRVREGDSGSFAEGGDDANPGKYSVISVSGGGIPGTNAHPDGKFWFITSVQTKPT